ncbi:NAD(P)-dependent dehydrogenase, short-chain alcohol dehydrogenase family [Actinacidiphila guanduensis]|uniref:NAD(P)-dependent dehydrogenase, short-chain alcohol dehydrogenase family n=1 Tax=Actinacidiphila guanduensis TaxID=310781 RepID=A0A1H0PY09_9ACTN|nr:NAD(P)-dependent dehydrogenase, short-chain alcohol dehydrogenase family [Actinacidiphila guanduensis]
MNAGARTPGRLPGKTALVTGATSNIGRAIAIAYAAEGAVVAVSGRDGTRGAQVVAEITDAGGRAVFVPATLDGSAAASRKLAADTAAALGADIDILVNNAGIFPGATTAATDEAMFDQVFAVNVKSAFFLTAEIAPKMAARGTGSVIVLGSWIVRLGIPVATAYAASKGALETLTRAWAAEYGTHGVNVNAISPGVIAENPAEGADHYVRGTVANKVESPQQIAHAAVYLASDEASFIHGVVLDVDGGRTTVAVTGA